MQERESQAAVARPPLDRSGWGPWHDGFESATPQVTMAWIGGALSIALWACATVLALQYL